MRTTRTIQIQGQDFQEAIYVYRHERFDVGGETFELVVIHVAGGLPNLCEFTLVQKNQTLMSLDVDLDATQTTSVADENGEKTVYSRKDALSLIRQKPIEMGLLRETERETAFEQKLGSQ